MQNFDALNLPENILQALKNINFKTPTPIQAQAIPVALEGHDIIGSAQTGTGKTAAFSIPMINHLMKNDNSVAMILLPTRELAAQVQEATKQMLGKMNHIKSALLIGGDSMVKQLNQLRGKPRIIVGTPGRINDHLNRRSLKLNNADFLVLDETDRMLDMGFGIQLEEIAKYLPEKRQTLMFSATLPKNIVNLSRKYLTNPVRISVGEVNKATAKIKQEIVKTNDGTKYTDLMSQLKERSGSVLIFVKTKHGADRLALKLKGSEEKASAIHGDLRQTRRDKVISDFRQQKYRILVATDLAARGLDIPHIEHVINYDLPQCPEDYIHRIGRTARAGAEGCAVNFLTPKDGAKWKEIYKLMNPSARDLKTLNDDLFPIGAEPLGKSSKPNSRRRHEGKSRRGSSDVSEFSVSHRKERRGGKSSSPKSAEKSWTPSFEEETNKPVRTWGKPVSLEGRKPSERSAKTAKSWGKSNFAEASSEKTAKPWARAEKSFGTAKPSRNKFNKNSKSFGGDSGLRRTRAK